MGDDDCNKEIQELANEESQDEDELIAKNQNTNNFSSGVLEKKEYSFPRLPKLDSSARVHSQAAQELKNERSQFDKVVNKSGQGFGAYQFTKKADKARLQQNFKQQLAKNSSNHNTS